MLFELDRRTTCQALADDSCGSADWELTGVSATRQVSMPSCGSRRNDPARNSRNRGGYQQSSSGKPTTQSSSIEAERCAASRRLLRAEDSETRSGTARTTE